MVSSTKITEKYISENKSIKECLKKGLINYSALSRKIKKDLNLGKLISNESILIASRRYKDKLKQIYSDDKIFALFKNSNLEIKNNIVVFTIDKNIYPNSLIDIEKDLKNEKKLFFAIEGTKSITLIIQKQNKELIQKRFKNNILTKKEELSLITLTSDGIWKVPGAVNYISGLFFENEINIEEFMSCHDDTLIVIESGDIEKAMKFLKF